MDLILMGEEGTEQGGSLNWREQFLRLLNQTEWPDDEEFLLMAMNLTGRSHRTQQIVNPSSPPAKLYCGEGLESFRKTYLMMHGYISLVVCLFGMLANTLNMIVLTRMDQRISATNAILTGLAFADNLVMIEYIPFAFHNYILRERPMNERFSYPWTVYVLIHAHVTQVFHTISIWLTLLLAVWRYLSVAHPLRSRDWCTLDRALLAILLAYVCSPLVCIPLYLTFTIQEKSWRPPGSAVINGTSSNSSSEYTLYLLGTSELAKANDSLLENINFWTYSVVIKLIPCVALTILSFRLISALVSAKERRQNLKSNNLNKNKNLDKNNASIVGSASAATSANVNVESGGGHSAPACSEKHDRTTRMLLAVLVLFLVTEFPQGILALLSGILGDAFFTNCYGHLGELMDILALINGAINFILYCVMSRQFRQTFNRLFKSKLMDKWNGVPATTTMARGSIHQIQQNNTTPTCRPNPIQHSTVSTVVNSVQPANRPSTLLTTDPCPVVV